MQRSPSPYNCYKETVLAEKNDKSVAKNAEKTNIFGMTPSAISPVHRARAETPSLSFYRSPTARRSRKPARIA